MTGSIYEAMGGAEAVLAVAEAWHRRCLDDPILAHAFEGDVHPKHTERLAAYWAEQLGGPAAYTDSIGDYSHVVRVHSGNGPHEQMDGRAVATFVAALDDAGVPTDPELRFQLTVIGLTTIFGNAGRAERGRLLVARRRSIRADQRSRTRNRWSDTSGQAGTSKQRTRPGSDTRR